MPKAKQRAGRRPRQREEAPPDSMPAASTYFRTSIRTPAMREVMNRVLGNLGPFSQPEDDENIQLINAAQTPQELVRLAGVAVRGAEAAWNKKLTEYGPAIVPAIERRLKTYQSMPDEKERGKAMENLVTALRWQGDTGAQALLACFNNLDDYGQSLACVVLGLLHASTAGDVIWRYYQRVRNGEVSYIVAALWGLIDLPDSRAADALDDVARNGPVFYEFFGFQALAGDARAVLPLMAMSVKDIREGVRKADNTPLMALAAVAQRAGRAACIAQLDSIENTPDVARRAMLSVIDTALAVPRDAIEETFELFYRDTVPDELSDGDVTQP